MSTPDHVWEKLRMAGQIRSGLEPLASSAGAQQEWGPVEAELLKRISDIKTNHDLFLFMANETRSHIGAQQVFVFWTEPVAQIVAISSLPEVNRQSPMVQDFERVMNAFLEAGMLKEPQILAIGNAEQEWSEQLKAYPFRNFIWTPIRCSGQTPEAGILYARKSEWEESQLEVLTRIAETYGGRIRSSKFSQRSAVVRANGTGREKRSYAYKAGLVLAAVLFVAMWMPTTMTVSAAFQVKSRDQLSVNAPLQGVIEEVYVVPGQDVEKDQKLVKFADVVQRNQVAITEREVGKSEAVLRRANQLSFEDEDGRRQIGPSMADLAVKRAELQFAKEQLARHMVVANVAGTVILLDEKSLIGRPFSIGERILEIANPEHVQFEIFLDINDAIALQAGATATLFPNSSPFRSIEAKLTQISYIAEPDAMGRLSFRLVAMPDGDLSQELKLGSGGTAKISGNTVRLGFYLFRRPVNSIRQWLGI